MPKEHFGSSSGDQPTSRFFKSLLLQVVQLSHFLGEGEEDLRLDAAKSRTDAGRLWTSTKHCRPPTSLRQLQATHLIIYQNPYQLYHLSTRTQHSASTFDIATFDHRHAITFGNTLRTSKIAFGQIIRMEINNDSINWESHLVKDPDGDKFWFNKLRIASDDPEYHIPKVREQ